MKRWAVAVVLALASVAALGPLMDTFDLSGTWELRLTREGAIEAARRLARAHGVETAGWSPLCRASLVSARAFFMRLPGRAEHPLLTGAQYEVSLLDPAGSRTVKMLLTADGRPLSFQQSFAPGRKPVPGATDPAALLALYAGAYERSFRRENEGVEQNRSLVDSWTWVGASGREATVRFEVEREQGWLRSAKIDARLPAEFVERYRRDSERQKSIQVSVATLAFTAVYAVAFPVFFRGLVRRRFPLSLLPRVFVFFAVLVALGSYFGYGVEDGFTARDTFSGVGGAIQNGFLLSLLGAGTYTLIFGAGRTLASDEDLRRWFSFESVLRGQWWTRPVGAALAGGVLCGCALAAVPFVGLVFGPPARPALVLARDAFSAMPALAAFHSVALNDAAALLMLVLPWRNRLRWPLGWLAFLLMGTALVSVARELFDYWMWPNYLAGAALAAGYLAIYFAFDLLAVLVAHLAMVAVQLAVAMSFQPAGLRMDALEVVAVPLLLLAGGLVLLTGGREVDVAREVERQKAELKEAGSDRDRLRAEFSVARKAQVGMLPEVPERIGATGLAALCHPAREVGGDLYDFFACPDGRFAICVADVSGKGVPASLYMSLTKGIMAAASAESTTIGELMGTLNRHLLAFGKRKMFVTMALGYYDPATRVLEHARAGHNPVLVWSARTGETTFLQPRGVGLGLAGVNAFAKALQVERVTLEPDDVVVFYSDGIVEAMNLAKDQFGEERLVEAVKDSARLSAGGVAEEIERRVRLFAGAAPVHDDQTLFVMRVG